VLHEIDFKAERVSPGERFARYGHGPAVVEVPTEDAAYELERELFERGCLVCVGTEALLAAGAIVIRVNAEAAEVTAEDLEARGIIRAAQDPFMGGGGI
jgi:hypothetical protein